MNIQIVMYFSLLFFFSELVLMMSKHSKKKRVKMRNDNKSLSLLWVTIPLSLTIGFFTAYRQGWNAINYSIAILGLCVFVIGIIVRWISIIQLNKGFTVDVVITENHKLKTDGIYKNIRHPSYLGLLLICFGLSIAMNSVISLAVISIPVLLAIIYRIKVEESILLKEFGEVYENYSKETYKIIPKFY